MHKAMKASSSAGFRESEKRPSDGITVGRLLDLHQAGEYCGVSYWLVRDWVADGILQPVRLPGSRLKGEKGKVRCRSTEHSLRKILLDRADLDRLIEECKR